MLGAMNPCFCGFLSDISRTCTCTPLQIQRYRARVSGPLLDRIDIQIHLPSIPVHDMLSDHPAESSAEIRVRVEAARRIQQKRFAGEGIHCNAQMNNRHIKKFCTLPDAARKLVVTAIDRLKLSGRAYHRILKVARTIADLAGRDKIQPADVAEAVGYRIPDRKEII
jgi:magnesium chelatase family protein